VLPHDVGAECQLWHREAAIARHEPVSDAATAALRELERVRRERRQLAMLADELDASGVAPESRIAAVLQEHKQKLDARFRILLQRANRLRA